MLRIWFHGTTRENAEQIQEEGFKIGTYFAKHLEDAIGYGGQHVLWVAIDFRSSPLKWQVINSNVISPDRIVRYEAYKIKCLFKNKALRKKVFLINTQNKKHASSN